MGNERPTHLDLFSGLGGFSLAFESAGFETIGFSETDPYASAVLKKHWPEVPNFGDVRSIPDTLRRLADVGIIPRVDVVTGGFPCQPFSVAGKRRGAADDRHLWPAMLQVLRTLIELGELPWFCGENVPGIVGMVLADILSDLEATGYQCAPFIVPACAVGAPHIRDRLWIIAHATGERCGEARQLRRDESAERIASGGKARDLADGEGDGLQPGRNGERSESQHAESIVSGEVRGDVADAQGVGEREPANEADAIATGGQARNESGDRSQSLADAASEQAERNNARGFQQEPARNGEAVSDASSAGREEFDAPNLTAKQRHDTRRIVEGRLHWSTDAGILRVADGIPNRVQRIKCLGNSIVPQLAQIFAKAIYAELTK
jgi:DNA (cytosine-5)-methyltransferase 1